MDQRVRVTVAVSVMLLGLLLSMPFRRMGSSQTVALRSETMLLNQQSAALPTNDRASAQKPTFQSFFAPAPPLPPTSPEPKHLAAAPVEPESTSAAAPTDASGTPLLAPTYPGPADANVAAATQTAKVAAFQKPLRPTRKITHRIVDGDSLAELAYRYLGTAARAAEIFDANRDVLSSPELLPIGAELKIPATGQAMGFAGR